MDRITIKTDASYRRQGGIGMGYVAQVDGKTLKGSGFIDRKCTSTEAEMLATAWSVHNLTERISKNPREETLVIQTDCQNTVTKFDSDYLSKEMKFIKHYKRIYDRMMMFWIPREDNVTADSIAKSMLRRGIEND